MYPAQRETAISRNTREITASFSRMYGIFHLCERTPLASLEPSNRQVNVRLNVADVKIFINARDYVWRLQIAAWAFS